MKPAVGGETPASISDRKKKNKTKVPRLEEYLQQRDYLGALTLLEVLTHIKLQRKTQSKSRVNKDKKLCGFGGILKGHPSLDRLEPDIHSWISNN